MSELDIILIRKYLKKETVGAIVKETRSRGRAGHGLRKRIWEVDCMSMDAAIAATFDWKDLVNLLQNFGQPFNFKAPENQLEMRAQLFSHQFCHTQNPVSLKIESMMNLLHRASLERFSKMNREQVMDFAMSFEKERGLSLGGVFWALGSDGRQGFDCLRRRFHQRFQVLTIRGRFNTVG